MTTLPPWAFAAALSSLDRMSLHRLNLLLDQHNPHDAFQVVSGALGPRGLSARLLDDRDLRVRWRQQATPELPMQLWEQCCELGLQVFARGEPDYPLCLTHDREAPPVLFSKGDIALLEGRRIGIVGTRNATLSGRETATAFGRDLANCGLHVVSGLARGIDGCAHRGVIHAIASAENPDAVGVPIAVVASGHDVVYPPEHRSLWQSVAETGVLLSECPPGTNPEPYRFPLRNRIIAALSEVLVVVESRSQGGSLITVKAAKDRQIAVMAVPGAMRNRAAEGTNQLLRDGCHIAADVSDILTLLHLDTRRVGGVAYDSRSQPGAADESLLRLCCEPVTLEHLVLLSSQTLVDCAMGVARLEAGGWLRQHAGWYEQSRLGPS